MCGTFSSVPLIIMSVFYAKTIFITITSQYNLKSGMVNPTGVLLFFNIILGFVCVCVFPYRSWKLFFQLPWRLVLEYWWILDLICRLLLLEWKFSLYYSYQFINMGDISFALLKTTTKSNSWKKGFISAYSCSLSWMEIRTRAWR